MFFCHSGKWWRTNFCDRGMAEPPMRRPLPNVIMLVSANYYHTTVICVAFSRQPLQVITLRLCGSRARRWHTGLHVVFSGGVNKRHKFCMEYEQNDFPDRRSSSRIFLVFSGSWVLGCGIFLEKKVVPAQPSQKTTLPKMASQQKQLIERVVVYSLISWDSFGATIETSDPTLQTMFGCLSGTWMMEPFWEPPKRSQHVALVKFLLVEINQALHGMFLLLQQFSSCGVPFPLKETSTFTKVTKVSLMYPDANAWWMNARFSFCVPSIPVELKNSFLMSLFYSSVDILYKGMYIVHGIVLQHKLDTCKKTESSDSPEQKHRKGALMVWGDHIPIPMHQFQSETWMDWSCQCLFNETPTHREYPLICSNSRMKRLKDRGKWWYNFWKWGWRWQLEKLFEINENPCDFFIITIMWIIWAISISDEWMNIEMYEWMIMNDGMTE